MCVRVWSGMQGGGALATSQRQRKFKKRLHFYGWILQQIYSPRRTGGGGGGRRLGDVAEVAAGGGAGDRGAGAGAAGDEVGQGAALHLGVREKETERGGGEGWRD